MATHVISYVYMYTHTKLVHKYYKLIFYVQLI